jgi:2-polyprenyl-6-methoxyphenol hydroxylase-like FAD-dependent oxidoreductase
MTAKKIPYRVFSGQRKTAEKTSFFNTLRSVATVTTPRAHKNNDDDERRNGRRLRVAIVGGGAAGMTTALHLAPLVAAGLIQGPVDVYEANDVKQSNKLRTSGHTNTKFTSTSGNLTEGGKQLYAGSGALGRHIGVGIWSTAWWPFLRSLEKGLSSSSGTSNNNSASTSSLTDIINEQKNRQSYKTLLKDLEACGSYVKDVGYRSPKGTWLVKSQLNASPYGINDLLHGTTMSTTTTAENHGSKKKAKSIDNDDPALLFVREKDLLSCLRNAIKIEQQIGTVKYNCGVRVECIDSLAGDTGSLELHHHTNENGSVSSSSSASTTTSPQYHLIIAADGLRSSLRSRYAGHHSIHATGLGMESSSQKEVENNPFFRWEHTDGHREAIRVENRGYIVFRGNAPKLTEDAEDGSGSFQSWFAAVPFRHAVEDLDVDDDGNTSVGHYSQTDTFKQRKKDEEVWFATINDPIFIDACKKNASEVNAEERKQLLLDAFGSWHNPVKTLIETTPAEGIMYEMALAHKHNAGPVFDIKTIMDFERWKKKKRKEEGAAERETVDKEDENNPSKKAFGPGPILVFIGDSMMTVDPVLAQGFTVAMESGASISRSIELALSSPSYSQELLRRELSERHARRERRLIHLLRTTEIVERLAQPHGLAIFAKYVVRPLMKFCPDGIKQGVFNFIIRYSLGLTGGERDSGGKQ